MRKILAFLMLTPKFWIGSVATLAVLGWIFFGGSEPKSANPWSSNYDPSLNNSGPRLRRVPRIRVETVYRDRDGVIHQQEDMKAIDAEKYK